MIGKKEKRISITISINELQRMKLKKLKEQTGYSISEIVRQFVEQGLNS